MKKNGNQIKKVDQAHAGDFSVRLTFEDGTSGRVFLGHLFEHPRGVAADVLKKSLFEKVFVDSGALAWPNGYELCPDALREWMDEQRKQEHVAV
jgi:hypothetical protein